jgi:hypothetical protein
MKRIFAAVIAFAASAMFATAQPAMQHHEPGLGEFMTATQLRHAKLWFAGKQHNWDLAAYEIDEIKEGLEDAARLHPKFDGAPVAEMIKTIIDPRIAEIEKAVRTNAALNLWSPSTSLPAVATAAMRVRTSPLFGFNVQLNLH